MQVASESALTSLVVTYRNDGEGPTVGTGRSELGAAEADDVRMAVNYAPKNGARSVILFGWLMGAAIALQLASEAKIRGIVAGLVLGSPILDWLSTNEANCARSGLPALRFSSTFPATARDALGTQFPPRLTGHPPAIGVVSGDRVTEGRAHQPRRARRAR